MNIIINISPPKSATSAFFHCLARSAYVNPPSVKEPYFFAPATGTDMGDIPEKLRLKGKAELGQDWFDSLFSDNAHAQYIVDFSTYYGITPEAPGLIHDSYPTAKMIFIARDPVERFVSHYYHLLKVGNVLPSMDDVITGQDDKSKLLFRYADYDRTIQLYRDRFGTDQVCVLKFSDLRDNPDVIDTKVRSFLGIDDFVFAPSQTEKHAAGQARNKLLRSLLFGPHIRALARFIPLFERLGLLQLRRKIVSWNTKKAANPDLTPQQTTALKQRLSAQYDLYDAL